MTGRVEQRTPGARSESKPGKARERHGHFGEYGGRYVPETLIAALDELEEAIPRVTGTPEYRAELDDLLANYAGRPTPLYHARRMSEELGGIKVYLKREDLAHTGAHKVNNVLGQALLARHMGKRRVIAETGAGQLGVATATFCHGPFDGQGLGIVRVLTQGLIGQTLGVVEASGG